MLLGINGVGKSTIAEKLICRVPGSVALSGSKILMTIFGGVSREELEKLSATEKMSMMELAFVEIFERHSTSQLVVLDTHLVVPIRKSGTLVLENIWSPRYAPYVRSVCFICASPGDIRQRRLTDERLTGRARDTNLGNIRSDQDLNLASFEEIIVPDFESMILQNANGQVDLVVDRIAEDIWDSQTQAV